MYMEMNWAYGGLEALSIRNIMKIENSFDIVIPKTSWDRYLLPRKVLGIEEFAWTTSFFFLSHPLPNSYTLPPSLRSPPPHPPITSPHNFYSYFHHKIKICRNQPSFFSSPIFPLLCLTFPVHPAGFSFSFLTGFLSFSSSPKTLKKTFLPFVTEKQQQFHYLAFAMETEAK